MVAAALRIASGQPLEDGPHSPRQATLVDQVITGALT
jgi:hypothetical protein